MVEEFDGDVARLHALWLEVAAERPWETAMDEGQFRRKHLDDPFVKKGFVLVHGADGPLAGAALVAVVPEMGRATVQLWVRPAMQRKGIGAGLVAQCATRLRPMGVPRLQAAVVPFCPGYNAFFRKVGFRPDAEYPGGILMRRATARTGGSTQRRFAISRSEKLDARTLDVMVSIPIGEEDRGAPSIDPDELKRERVASLSDAERFCVSIAHADSRPVGYTTSALVRSAAGEVQLRNRGLIVSPGHRGKGIGGALLRDGLDWGRANGAMVAYISTHSKNPARRLYEKEGYAVVETVENQVLDLDR
jgi:GNAT superfamily N-acetyltransferase